MKLYYYQRPDGIQNFGDDLNSWLWNRLLKKYINRSDDSVLIGIGTLLNNELVENNKKINKKLIFSTGVGYGNGLPKLDDSYKIYCLRGPLSAKALGVDPNLGIADGAILIRRLVKIKTEKKYEFSYMPHFAEACPAWHSICQRNGFQYISSRQSIEEILDQLGKTKILIAEAMHGAIVADALRIPWIPVTTNPGILQFKWQDWCQSLGLDYQPKPLARIMTSLKRDRLSLMRNFRNHCSNLINQQKVSEQILEISNSSFPVLSKNSILEEKTSRLEDKLDHLKNDLEISLQLL